MKICILTSSYPLWPGHYRGHFIRHVALEFVRKGHEVKIVTPGCFGVPSIEYDKGIFVKRFSYFPFQKYQCLTTGEGILPNLRKKWLAWFQIPFFLLASIFSVKKEAIGCDIIHAHWSVNGISALLCRSKYRVPVVTSVRGSDYSLKKKHIINTVTEAILKRVDGVITENGLLRKRICAAGIEQEKTVAIHNGVDVNLFRPGERGASLRINMGAQGKRVILFVGRLTHVKGPDLALSAFKKIIPQFPETILLFAGDGDMRRPLSQTSAKDKQLKNRVLFFGQIDTSEMPEYYNASDILLISSRAEGTPNALLEGIASGMPVVSFPVGGIPEIISDGTTGILAKEDTVEALADALIRVLSDADLRLKIAKNARGWAEINLCWTHTTNRYLRFYNQIISRFSGNR